MSLVYNEQSDIFTKQLQELARYFCNIENSDIRDYAINLMKEVSKISDSEEAKKYCDDMLN